VPPKTKSKTVRRSLSELVPQEVSHAQVLRIVEETGVGHFDEYDISELGENLNRFLWNYHSIRNSPSQKQSSETIHTLWFAQNVVRRRLPGRVRLTNHDRWFFIQLYRWFRSLNKDAPVSRPVQRTGDQFTRHPGRTSSPLCPRLSCRYTQPRRHVSKVPQPTFTTCLSNQEAAAILRCGFPLK
jgi:hypothetical protein